MSKQTFHLPTWRRKPTADEAAPDIADSAAHQGHE